MGAHEILVGASLSLSGTFRLQGEQALNGLGLWADHVAGEGRIQPRVLALDDRSRASLAKENVLRLLTHERVDCLIGPYSSGLTLAVAPLAEAHQKILWNHGGASDAISQHGWRHLVSVPSPAGDYFRSLPLWVKRRDPEARRIAILYGKAGSFAGQVAQGAAESARAAGFDLIRLTAFDSPSRNAPALFDEALEPVPDVLVGVGSFQDDIAMVRRRELLAGVKSLAVVAAGLAAFQRELGDLAEGVIGPSQWEPGSPEVPLLGPDSAWFCSAFRRRFHQDPEYPAAQAFAVGVIFTECLRRAGSLEDESLLRAAHALETTTLYGRFRLDPVTSRQIGHGMLLVQWRDGRKQIL
ncbi:MAG: amino acid ABC transporter substrate-binding protein [Candidatus Rokubacteria bacterium]|nr:amino acid ABC transporter substrate-binding protein [Candidatus Rokubacteria bacterium]